MSAPLTYRLRCRICLQPEFSCYCAHLKPFDPGLTFVILIHPIEAQRRVATGRMSHLSLKGSYLIRGHDYSSSDQVNAIIDNPAHQCFLLYPGPQSTDLSPLGLKERLALFDPTLKPVIFVVDGTWSTARKMVNLSHNLKRLPRIQVTPPTGSRFRVRRQPKPNCYSTIEAIHHTIDLFGLGGPSRDHDRLLQIFDHMVEQQIELSRHKRWRGA